MFRKYSHFIVLGIVGLSILASDCYAETYQIDAGHSSVSFSIRHIVSRIRGQFDEFSGKIVYDPEQVDKASVEATIQTASINTSNERRDNHLKNADFFEVDTYPTMEFKSSKVEKASENMLKVSGDLTLHGITKSVVMDVEIIGVGLHPARGTPMAGFEGHLKISRVDFGMDSWAQAAAILGEEVDITLNVESTGPQPEGRRGRGRQGGGRGGRGGRGRQGGGGGGE